MPQSSFTRVQRNTHHTRRVRLVATLTTLIALVLVAVLALSFVQANRLMREPAKQLDSFSSNILPPFQLVNFTSLDGQTRLQGWFFEPRSEPVSTIILVHDQGENRLQFGLDTARLIEHLLDQRFCVLAFDLRRSGQSEGDLSVYGYAEWADVLAAVSYARTYAVTSDVILYGFGSGVTASLLAVDNLPPDGTLNDPDLTSDTPDEILALGIDQSYIKGLILDTPCSSGDEYIRAACRGQDTLGRMLYQYTVPLAIRFSAASSVKTSLVTLLTQFQMPVFITASEQADYVRDQSVQTLIDERMRFHPDETDIFRAEGSGYIDGFVSDRDNYLENLSNWLSTRFGS